MAEGSKFQKYMQNHGMEAHLLTGLQKWPSPEGVREAIIAAIREMEDIAWEGLYEDISYGDGVLKGQLRGGFLVQVDIMTRCMK